MGVSSVENTPEKTMTLGNFFAFIVSKNGCFSTNFFFVCDTCDSRKTKSLLEGARIYAREEDVQISTALSLAFLKEFSQTNNNQNILTTRVVISYLLQSFSVTFPRFFHSLGLYLPIYL